MKSRQEFLVLRSEGHVTVYTVRTFPLGTPIGGDAERLEVDGPSPARPPKTELSTSEFDDWRRHLESAGYALTLGPYWGKPVSREEFEESVRRGEFIPLKEAFDELLLEAEARRAGEDQPVEPVESRHP